MYEERHFTPIPEATMQYSMGSPQEHVVSVQSENSVMYLAIIEEELMEFWIQLVQHASGCIVWFDVGTLSNGMPCYVVSTLGETKKVRDAIDSLTTELESLIAHSQKKTGFGMESVTILS